MDTACHSICISHFNLAYDWNHSIQSFQSNLRPSLGYFDRENFHFVYHAIVIPKIGYGYFSNFSKHKMAPELGSETGCNNEFLKKEVAGFIVNNTSHELRSRLPRCQISWRKWRSTKRYATCLSKSISTRICRSAESSTPSTKSPNSWILRPRRNIESGDSLSSRARSFRNYWSLSTQTIPGAKLCWWRRRRAEEGSGTSLWVDSRSE